MITRILLLLAGSLSSVGLNAQIAGCTDPLAENYQPMATINDGSCLYAPEWVFPTLTWDLPSALNETSGLIRWDDLLWTHNDDTDTRLYGLDGSDGSISLECLLPGVSNQDWEDVDQDDTYVYIGDFGNNSSGNRQDLHILRVEKASLCSGSPTIDTIWFQYEDQSDFSTQASNTTDFDCEAMVVGTDSIYLITKQWTSLGTVVYALPKDPGNHDAEARGTFPVNGLITGATWVEEKHLLVLCGYSSLLQPFVFLCYDYAGTDFFTGNKRRLDLALPFHQVEGITTTDGLTYALTNERFAQVLMIPPRLHALDLSPFLVDYLGGSTALDHQDEAGIQDQVTWQDGRLNIVQSVPKNTLVRMMDLLGRPIFDLMCFDIQCRQELVQIPSGLYLVHVGTFVHKVWVP
ncbi:MAG: T9SS C-terminal target domain-containing protein [Lewinellaceae bacterium]|nr:hypothetical protein [Saprospiraceae bacterium]MCB9312379.1 T9SS C-terminal target domain-containing protein [Lewinellaceae bacterium]